jgi:hypothetical protein
MRRPARLGWPELTVKIQPIEKNDFPATLGWRDLTFCFKQKIWAKCNYRSRFHRLGAADNVQAMIDKSATGRNSPGFP